MTEVPPVSNSEMVMFADCPRRWWLTHVLNLGLPRRSIPVTGALAFGTRIHRCLELHYEQGRDPLEVYEELHETATEALKDAEGENGYPDPDQWKKLDDEHKLGRAMLEGFLEWSADTGLDEGMTFLGAERLVQVASGIEGVMLRGKLDQLWQRDIDGAVMFRDFKTASELKTGPAALPMNEQFMFYVLLLRLERLSQGRTDLDGIPRGGMYTMLKKVKRTGRAQPPFYDQVEVMYNEQALRSMYLRVHRRLEQMMDARQRLAQGQDHRYVVPPRPTKDCTWKCPFLHVCPMADDTPDETFFPMLDQLFVKSDPYERYLEEDSKA